MKSAARAWRTVGKGCLRHDDWLRDAVLVVDAFWLNRRKLRKEAAPRRLCDGGAHRRPGERRWHRARHGRWRVRRNAKHGVVDAAPVVGSFVRRTSVRRSSQRLQRVIGRRVASDPTHICTSLRESSRSGRSFEVRSEALLVTPKFGPVPRGSGVQL